MTDTPEKKDVQLSLFGDAEAAPSEKPTAAQESADAPSPQMPVEFNPEVMAAQLKVGKPLNKRGCTMMILLGCFLGWAALAIFIIKDEPDRIQYEVRSATSSERTIRAGRYSVSLPLSWREEKSTHSYISPQGIRLSMRIGTMKGIPMSPKDMQGRVKTNQYTAVSYGVGLLKRFDTIKSIRSSRYFTLGRLRGLEALLDDVASGAHRSFAIVRGETDVFELRFFLPNNDDAEQGKAVEDILRTVQINKPSRAKPRRTKKGSPSGTIGAKRFFPPKE